ncbi:hypothetical protein I8748_32975 [Nostoc sp. CENA67]|uniref:Uncharacterized protein n=1 Tax=Amazonocrinis nigriterrae CENA67 TaxID=2794033 RepID=A0A8J7LCK9_9NOST|nr:hypothetical protein [Amazonocrinis nigriterrae]MBH8566905.1 hypothetical protein [Amazonocrinis nigriterrae CENA67]
MIATDGRLVGAGLKILSMINDDLGEPAPTEFHNLKSKIQNGIALLETCRGI